MLTLFVLCRFHTLLFSRELLGVVDHLLGKTKDALVGNLLAIDKDVAVFVTLTAALVFFNNTSELGLGNLCTLLSLFSIHHLTVKGSALGRLKGTDVFSKFSLTAFGDNLTTHEITRRNVKDVRCRVARSALGLAKVIEHSLDTVLRRLSVVLACLCNL